MKQRFFTFSMVLILVTLSLLNAPLNHATISASSTRDISLDCNNISGRIVPFGEINCGPLPNPNMQDGKLLTQEYRETGIDFVRTHDFSGPTDISMIFPDFTADPTDPLSYNFTETDKYITSIVNANCHVFYRLGESASDNNSLRQPPSDFEKWAEICKHIVMHYNDGWSNGFQYNITYFEVWNEPDLAGFWNGTADQYYQLYQITAETLKSYNPALHVGGPCTSSLDNTNFTDGFLAYLRDNNIPLDFFSWHMYADSPNQLYNGGLFVRKLLNRYGFTDAESINTEWNINLLYPQRDNDNAKNAAFTAGSLTVFQDAYIDKAFRYRGTQDDNWLLKFIGFDVSLFTVDGVYKTPALSYLAMNLLCKDTPLRLASETMTAETGITLLAGISEDKTNISLILSNYEADTTTLSITFDNLPWNTSFSYVQYCIDDSHHLEITDKKEQTSEETMFTLLLPPSTVYFIRLTNSTSIPHEGPDVAAIPLFLRLPIFDPLARFLAIAIVILILS